MKYGSRSEKEHQKLKFELTGGLSPSKKKNFICFNESPLKRI